MYVNIWFTDIADTKDLSGETVSVMTHIDYVRLGALRYVEQQVEGLLIDNMLLRKDDVTSLHEVLF